MVQVLDTVGAVDRFNRAFNSHDVDEIMAAMTHDCVFESTFPPPDGDRYVGQAAVRKVWEDLFKASPDAHFEAEEQIVSDDRCIVRWVYTFTDDTGLNQHLRGVDVLKVRDGKIAEKLSYVKG